MEYKQVYSVRSQYCHGEDLRIVRFLAKNRAWDQTNGNLIWKVMEDKKVCPNRTYQSMRNRFLRNIKQRLKNDFRKTLSDYNVQFPKHFLPKEPNSLKEKLQINQSKEAKQLRLKQLRKKLIPNETDEEVSQKSPSSDKTRETVELPTSSKQNSQSKETSTSQLHPVCKVTPKVCGSRNESMVIQNSDVLGEQITSVPKNAKLFKKNNTPLVTSVIGTQKPECWISPHSYKILAPTKPVKRKYLYTEDPNCSLGIDLEGDKTLVYQEDNGQLQNNHDEDIPDSPVNFVSNELFVNGRIDLMTQRTELDIFSQNVDENVRSPGKISPLKTQSQESQSLVSCSVVIDRLSLEHCQTKEPLENVNIPERQPHSEESTPDLNEISGQLQNIETCAGPSCLPIKKRRQSRKRPKSVITIKKLRVISRKVIQLQRQLSFHRKKNQRLVRILANFFKKNSSMGVTQERATAALKSASNGNRRNSVLLENMLRGLNEPERKELEAKLLNYGYK